MITQVNSTEHIKYYFYSLYISENTDIQPTHFISAPEEIMMKGFLEGYSVLIY